MKHPEVAGRECRGGTYLPLSHMHTPSQIFQNTLCTVRWHRQSSQCLVCPLSICDNASVGSCSGGPGSLCFLGSSWVVWGQKMCAHVTGIVRYIGKSVFWHQNISASPNFFFGGGGWWLRPPCPSFSDAYDILIVLETTEEHKVTERSSYAVLKCVVWLYSVTAFHITFLSLNVLTICWNEKVWREAEKILVQGKEILIVKINRVSKKTNI